MYWKVEQAMRLRYLFVCFSLTTFCFGLDSGNESDVAVSEEEALFLRRISEFWQEGEFQIAKTQIEEFIVQFPSSSFSDALCSALGDLYLREKNFTQALSFYSQIVSQEYLEKVFLNRMQCLYQMQWYATLADECESLLNCGNCGEKILPPAQKLQATYFLAIALYQQCLNAAKEPETLVKLAERAQPYFETLFQTELSNEVAQSFAHLCCILKDFPKASRIYKDLASKDPETAEEMLFQAALIQSQYDKEGSLEMFDSIAKMGKERAKEAAYNRLVLTFDTGKHAQLTQAREDLLAELPEEKKDSARIYLGRSLFALKKYQEATDELKGYVLSADAHSGSYPAAVLSLVEAAFQSDDLEAIDLGIEKLKDLSRKNSHLTFDLPKALFSRALVLKKNQKTAEAQQELELLVAQFPRFNQRAQALFELAHLNYQQNGWSSCREWSRIFISEFPEHELAPFAWRYFISSSSELAGQGNLESKKQLLSDLTEALNQKEFFSSSERIDWQFLYVKTLVQLGIYPEATALLESLLDPASLDRLNKRKGAYEANAWFLLSLCYRDGLKDLAKFCEAAEKALEKKTDLAEPAKIHLLLFNSYLERANANPEWLEKSASHLFSAFEQGADINRQNLFWLADFYFSRLSDAEAEQTLAGKIAAVLEHCLRFQAELKPAEIEPAICKLAECYSLLGNVEKQRALLENWLEKKTSEEPNAANEIYLLLGDAYVRLGEKGKALRLFDQIAKESSTLRSSTAASACLQSAKLSLSSIQEKASPDFAKTAAQLKNLILQKTLPNEPCHLEAAFEYIDLQSRFEKEEREKKRISLLLKTKSDFEQTSDILSKDYHEARSKFPRKNQIYADYMRLIDAEILLAQASLIEKSSENRELEEKELQAKAKVILLQIIEGKTHPFLTDRAKKTLQSNEKKPETKA